MGQDLVVGKPNEGRVGYGSLRLFRTVPAVRGKALQVQMAAQQQIARELHAAFPGELDRVRAAALAGAFTGAVSGALTALMNEDDTADGITPDAAQLRARVRQATELALRPWQHWSAGSATSTPSPPG